MLHVFVDAAGRWLLPIAAVSLVLVAGGVVGLLSGRRRGALAVWGGMWLPLMGISLTPGGSYLVDRRCALSIDLPSPARLLSITEPAINVWPHAVVAALATLVVRLSWVPLALTIATPFVLEGIQFLVRSLGRSCSATDVVLNLSGILLGTAVGWCLTRLVASRRLPR